MHNIYILYDNIFHSTIRFVWGYYMKKKEIIFLTILFIAAFWLWTLPIQKNSLPFGEGDAAYHFAYGDYTSYSDKTLTERPPYLWFWYYIPGYYKVNEQPPSARAGYAFMQILGGERIIPVYIFIAIASFLGIFSTYFLIKKLYGFAAGFGVGLLLLISSHRAVLYYLWGQRPTVASFAFIPIMLYAFYRYMDSYYKGENKIIYLYIFALLFSSSYLIHLQAIVLVVPIIFLYTLAMSFREKKIPVDRDNIKHIVISLIIIIVICLPFLPRYTEAGLSTETDLGLHNVGNLFSWFKIPPNNFDLNPTALIFIDTYGTYFSLIPLLIGISYLVLKRNSKNLLIISALAGLYIMFHLDVFGLVVGANQRQARYLIVETYFFFSVIMLGIIFLINFIKINKKYKNILKYGAATAFVIVILLTSGKQNYLLLANAYQGISRITPAQYEVSEWLSENVPENGAVHYYGVLTYPKYRFMSILSRRPAKDHRYSDINERYLTEGLISAEFTHVVIDYSDSILIGDQNEVINLQKLEKSLINASLVYSKNNIGVYRFD